MKQLISQSLEDIGKGKDFISVLKACYNIQVPIRRENNFPHFYIDNIDDILRSGVIGLRLASNVSLDHLRFAYEYNNPITGQFEPFNTIPMKG